MKKSLLWLLLVLNVAASAQERAKYRIVYRLDYLAEQKDTVRQTLNWELDAGDSTALFCNVESRMMYAKLDSLNKANVDLASGLSLISKFKAQYPLRDHLEMVYNYHTYDKCTTMNTISLDSFRYEDSIPNTQWKLSEGNDRAILGMQCKRAEGDVRGRHWIVWYTEELPFRIGPWLLGGLPGLVLAAEDSEGIFRFTASGMENNPPVDVALHKDKMIKTTKKKFYRLRKEFDEDNIGYLLRVNAQRVLKVTDAKGNEIKHSKSQNKNYFER